MRVSRYFRLGLSQPALDFVDVDVNADTAVFVDPHAIRSIESEFTDECVSLIQNFFGEILRLAKTGDDVSARALLDPLREPNETHLGLSKGESRGRALGEYLANEIWKNLKASKAIKTGLIEDLEDTLLLIDGIGPDIISDVTTNIIRGPLIAYTAEMCSACGMPLTHNVDPGPLWNPLKKRWEERYASLPYGPKAKLLLIPKAIVRKQLGYDVGEYHRDYILEQLVQRELSANTELVRLIRTKKGTKKKVFKKDVRKKYGSSKSLILNESLKNPELLADYRREKQGNKVDPLTHEEISANLSIPKPEWDKLLDGVTKIPPGTQHASEYESAVAGLLTALFYPSLVFPVQQHPIHQGRKRLDISYSNAAKGVFFSWLAQHYPSPKVIVECKNYSGEVANPELDQLSGRFSPNRGMVGILVCREFDNKSRFLERCRDTAQDQRGFIIALDDDDLKALVRAVKVSPVTGEYPLIRARFDRLIS